MTWAKDSPQQVVKTNSGLKVLAPAKINLTLLVAGKRADGFYEIETIMAKINFFDELIIEPRGDEGVELICAGPEQVPTGSDNLVYQACEQLFRYTGQACGVRITLIKNIPVGSGLGSASSDVAAALIGLNELFGLQLGQSELMDIAADISSDAAFFLDGPLAICTGKGEKIKKITSSFDFTALVVLAPVSVSTKRVYDNYRHDVARFESLKQQINRYIEKNRIDLAAKMCANMLQDSCFSLHRELAELKAQIESMGIGPLCLSGSGSAMYWIIEEPRGTSVEEYQRKIERETRCKCIIVTNNRW